MDLHHLPAPVVGDQPVQRLPLALAVMDRAGLLTVFIDRQSLLSAWIHR